MSGGVSRGFPGLGRLSLNLLTDSITNHQLDALRLALPSLLGNLDETTFETIRPHLSWEWVELAGGKTLFLEGDSSDALYVLISGRLQATVTTSAGQQLVGEIGRGETIGEMGVFTGRPRRATITAARDSVLARIEVAAFEKILKELPSLAINLNRVIIERLQKRNTSQKMDRNVRNVALVSISENFRPGTLLRELLPKLENQQQTVWHVTSALIDDAAGRSGAAQVTEADSTGHHWLVNYLDELENRYGLVLYETDRTPSPWTRRCLRQADDIWLLGAADASPDLSQIEQECLSGAGAISRAGQTLILLHSGAGEWARGATEFLALRPWISRHYHVRTGHEKDVARLARFMTGNAIGLVLAGGGARGIAHIGVFRALEEAGMPVDSLGGTSIGSVMAACLARDWGWEQIFEVNRRVFLSNPTSDFNLIPLVSLLAGRKLDRILAGSWGDRQIEELWRPFFCVSSNYTQACEMVHAQGNIKRAVLASMAIPGVFPPIIHGNDLLVDGGMLNNMPVDVMARTGISNIMAVDLRPDDKQRDEFDFDQVPNTWQLLADRLKPPARRRYRLPSMLATLMTATTLNSQQKMSQVVTDVDLLFNPDVRRFGLLDWKSFDLIVEQGYRHAVDVIEKHPSPF
jgi:NTE family protein